MKPYRIERGEDEPSGRVMMKIVDGNGRMLYLDEIASLATTPEPTAMSRHLEFVLADESQPKHGKPVLRPQCLKFTHLPPLMFAGHEIGTVNEVLRCQPGTVDPTIGVEGTAAIGTATLKNSALSGLVWDALNAGILGAVCLHGDGQPDETGELPAYVARFVNVVHVEASCIENAKVLRLREEPIQEERHGI